MKFTSSFIAALKNFSVISAEMYFTEGNVQTTFAKLGTMFASYVSDVSIEKSFAILDLPKLLSVLSLFEEPNIEHKGNFLLISSGQKSINYQLTNPDFIKYEKNPKRFSEKPVDIEFKMTQDDYTSMMKISGVLKSEELKFEGDGSKIYLSSTTNNDNGDSGKIILENTDKVFSAVVKTDNLKLMANDYLVRISSKGFINFRSEKLEYYMVIEKDKSRFGT
jgi:hypothetical protein